MRLLLLLLTSMLLVSCQNDEESYVAGLGFDEYVPVYNDYIVRWVDDKLQEARKEMDGLEPGSEAAKNAAKKFERFERRSKVGGYFAFKPIEKLPENLPWKDGMDEPIDSDPKAKKGGVFRYYRPDFPATVRPFGPRASAGWRSELYDDVQTWLVSYNRLNRSIIPGVAREWAHSEDKRTWFFRLDEDAEYTDGVKVKAKDYAISIYLRGSDYAKDPYGKQYWREQISQIAIYDEHTFSVTFPEAKGELGMYYAIGDMAPSPPHFYDEFGPDWEERYNWRPVPSTGPYYVKEGDIVKGVSITLTRKKDWWGNKSKFYRYRFNPDQIVWTTIRDTNKAFELFRAGQLEMYRLSQPDQWYEKTEIEPVYKGYIEKHWWYNDFPRPQFGFELNLSRKKLQDQNVRLGLSHSINWEKVLNVVFWGDYNRLPGFVDGFGDFVNPEVQARKFDPQVAREYFAKAGYTKEGEDGVLRKPDGTRLEFELSHYTASIYPKIVAIIKNEAKMIGVDLILNGGDPQSIFTNALDKKFEITFVAWAVQPPYFSFYEYFHSRNAYDEQGNIKPKTNNVFAYNDPEMDRWCEESRLATSDDEKRKWAHLIQKQAYDRAVFIPGWKMDYERVACWRWLRWPDSETVKFCPPVVSRPNEHYSFWIDVEMQQETLEAMREGKTFPEVQNVVEDYRKK